MKLARVTAALMLLAMPACALVCTFLAYPAHAQIPNINLVPDTPSNTQDQIDAEEARDKAYKESLKKIPDAKTSSDPWGTVRSDTPKSKAAAPTAAAKKTKPGNNAN